MNGFELKTYHSGLLQARAYRALRYYMADFLKKYHLSMMEWTLLGHISESNKEGINISQLAELFGVETSLMTNSINKLHDKGLVGRTSDVSDKRIRLVRITKKGGLLVKKVEKKLSASLEEWLKDINPKAIVHYMEVLKYLANKN
ncbi:MarR family transcriptional regulator [Candidatus Saccharibacteria bacterium]|nr:MarR family transcriptional regulator [Candidatus Saccharibacteria bacterium]